MDKIHEECGVFGIWSNERTDVAEDILFIMDWSRYSTEGRNRQEL